MQRLQEYVKYTKKELDSYSETEGSCVFKINQNLHFAINAYILNDMNTALPAYILKNKVGYYDSNLNGIILAVKNIKVLNGAAALRFDDPKLHMTINADCYVFRPEEGAVLTGIAKHVGKHHVGVIIYGVFNASVRLEELVNKDEVKLNKELKFKVKNFNIRIAHPYIQGTLLHIKREKDSVKNAKSEGKRTTFGSDDEGDNDNDNVNDVSNNTPDSGIDEKGSNDRDMELDELLSMIKNEPLSEVEQEIEPKPSAHSVKRKRKSSLGEETPTAKIKKEPEIDSKKSIANSDKRKTKSSVEEKESKTFKQKSGKFVDSSDSSDSKEKVQAVVKKIKKEKNV